MMTLSCSNTSARRGVAARAVQYGVQYKTRRMQYALTAVRGGSSDALSVLAAQLAVKDGQISRLQDALDAAQETAKAVQVLHAQERRAIESAEQKSR